MTTQKERARLLHNLHIKGDPVIVFNIWDAGSAKCLLEIGAKVIATGSWSVAAAHGYADREKLPYDLVIANLQRIVESVDLPVDFFVDPAILDDPDTRSIDTITLSYTFYPADKTAAVSQAEKQAATQAN